MLAALAGTEQPEGPLTAAAAALRQPGAVILVGERLAERPGRAQRGARLAEATGAAAGLGAAARG